MFNLDYEAVNNIIKTEIANDNVMNIIGICKKLLPLFDLIFKKCETLPERGYEVELEDSISLALSYLKSSNPVYYDETKRMMENNEIHIADYSLDNAGCDSYTGEILLGNNRNISDGLTLIHELFHHFNLKPFNKYHQENTISRELFGEAISIAAELDFERNLEDKTLLKDARKFEIDYINDAIDCIRKIKVELVLIDLYNIYGKIDKEVIYKFILNNKDNAFGSIVIEEVESVISNITSWGSNLKIPFNLKYAIGIIFGYYLADLIEKEYEKWFLIYDLNNKLYDLNFDEILNKICPNYDANILFECFYRHYDELKKAITI